MRWFEICETYSRDNIALMRYMKDGKFDPYQLWWYVCVWAEETDNIDAFNIEAGSKQELNDEDSQIFYNLPPNLQKECEQWVYDFVSQHDPSELPTHQYLHVSDKQLLKRTTWLVHFSDNADDIAVNGFTQGVDDMGRLGLTTHLDSFYKNDPGFNFAFVAKSRDARFAASKGKYGDEAVLFQNSCVYAYHCSDEENQVMFYGPDVKPQNIIWLRKSGGDWCVYPKGKWAENKEGLFTGDFDKCVDWVIGNFAQYRKVLTGK